MIVFEEEGKWVLKDTWTTNGTSLNGFHVRDAAIKDGDVITIANRTIVVHLSAMTEVGNPKEALGGVIEISRRFEAEDVDDRIAAATEISALAPAVPMEDILNLCRSSQVGRRTAGFVCLRIHIQNGLHAGMSTPIGKALRKGMSDASSLVRYRAIAALRDDPKLAFSFRNELERVRMKDENGYVRDKAREALEAAKRLNG
jgi:hypothetical protein